MVFSERGVFVSVKLRDSNSRFGTTGDISIHRLRFYFYDSESRTSVGRRLINSCINYDPDPACCISVCNFGSLTAKYGKVVLTKMFRFSDYIKSNL